MYCPSASTLDTLIWTVRLVTDSGSEKPSRLNGTPLVNPASRFSLTLEFLCRFHSAFRISFSPRYTQLRWTFSPRTAVTLREISTTGSSHGPDVQKHNVSWQWSQWNEVKSTKNANKGEAEMSWQGNWDCFSSWKDRQLADGCPLLCHWKGFFFFLHILLSLTS